MKTGKSILLGVLLSGLTCLIGMVSCDSQPSEQKAQAALGKKGGMVVTMEVAQPETAEYIAAIHQARLEQFGAKKAFVKVTDDNRIIAIVPEVNDFARVRRLLQADGRWGVWETYEIYEIYSRLEELNSVLSAEPENRLFGLLNPFVTANGEPMSGPAVGTVNEADTARVMSMLTSETAKHILQRDVRFMWTAKPVSEDAPYYYLIALKAMRDGQAALRGDVITKAKVAHNQWSPEPVIDFAMNEEGARAWRYLTRDNIGKSIAIVVDNQLYSYPKVMCEIEGGKSQIAGNFTEEEAADLANILNSGMLPCPVRIIDEQIIEPQK